MRRARDLGWLILVAVAYFVAGRLGLRLAFVHANATAVWPPTGIALAAVLLRGPRVWPAVFVAAFFVNQTAAGSAATSLGIAAGNTLEALLGGWLVRRFADGTRAFDRPPSVLRFALAAGLLSTAVSATLGTASLALLGHAQWGRVPAIWLTWWLGDLSAALIVTPPILMWAARPRWEHGARRLAEAALILMVVVLTGLLAFGALLPPSARGSPIAFACLPPLVWAAFRFGQRETSTATLVLCAIALAGTLRGLGPYGRETPLVALPLLQGYVVVTGLMVLALAAAVA